MKTKATEVDADGAKLQSLLRRFGSRTPISWFDLEESTVNMLAAGNIRCLGDVQESINPIHMHLRCDLPTFSDVWLRLVALGLRDGTPTERWEALIAASTPDTTLDDVVEEMQCLCAPRDWEILARLYRLDCSTTRAPANESEGATGSDNHQPRRFSCAAVGRAVGLTRERIRQLESRAFADLRQATDSCIVGLMRTLSQLTRENAGIITLHALAQRLTAILPPGRTNAEQLAHLLMKATDEFWVIPKYSAFGLKTIDPQVFHAVIARAREEWRTGGTRMSEQAFVGRIVLDMEQSGQRLDEKFVRACLEVRGPFTPTQPPTISFDLSETLRAIGKPAHYSVIAEGLNASNLRKGRLSTIAVHRHLMRSRHVFVQLGRGVFSLPEWNIEAGWTYERQVEPKSRKVEPKLRPVSIGSLAEEFLTQRDAPARLRDISAYVRARKQCQVQSIMGCMMMDKRFHRFAVGMYGLKCWVTKS